jgi:hypothetical protein
MPMDMESPSPLTRMFLRVLLARAVPVAMEAARPWTLLKPQLWFRK